jgi:muconolactone delta-isomerase
MQFITMSRRLTERFTDADFASLAEQESEQARALYAEGFIRQIWRRVDVPGACILVEADTEEQVRAGLNRLPLVRAGMLEVLIVPLQPYAGFYTPSRALRTSSPSV